MFSSPRPVEPAPPTSWSRNKPAPINGESPTRPAIFHALPLVVVAPDISPFEFTHIQLIVPFGGRKAISIAQARVASSECGNCSCSSRNKAAFPDFSGGASTLPDQFVCPERSRIDRFHTSQARRDF